MLSSETGTQNVDGDGTPRKSPRQSPRPQIPAAPQQDKQVNPLEKIEQLLTCSICLDRYKNPKLLPCQHTYCLQCLDNYVDTVHHNLKCPECRADHSIPYDGAKGFPTNFTLTGFLDIHLEATDDNSEQIEAYISRYNMERCKICDEKSELEVCPHCDRKTCKECRNAHMAMLKRDLGRLLNQVRRLSNRVKEASDGVNKNIKGLEINVKQTQIEVKDYFQRYQAEMKKREDYFLNEIELFEQNEQRLMKTVRDVLDAEHKNLEDSCEWVESAINGEIEIKDQELCRYKTVLTDGVENLRSFQPDTEDLFSKKLRFSPGDDTSKLPMAIVNFGDLTVLLPQFAGRYLPLEQQYLPKPLRLGLESDFYKISSRTALEDKTAAQLTSKFKRSDDYSSQRTRRQMQLDEDSGLSYRSTNRSPLTVNGLNSSSNSSSYTRSSLLAPTSSNATSSSTITTEVEEPASSISKNTSASSDLLSRRRQNQTPLSLPSTISSSETTSSSKDTKTNGTEVVTPTRRQKFKIICRSTSSNPMKRSGSSDSLEFATGVLNTTVPSASSTQRQSNGEPKQDTSSKSSGAFANSSSSNYHSTNSVVTEAAAAVAQTIARLRSQDQLAMLSSEDSIDSSPPPLTPKSRAEWLVRRRERFLRSRTNPDIFGSMDASDRAKLKASTNTPSTQTTALSARVQQLLTELEFKNALADNSTTSPSPRSALNGSRVDEPETSTDSRSRFARRSSILDRDLTERSRSRTNRTSLLSLPLIDYGSKSKPRLVFGRKGDTPECFNMPRGIVALPGSEFAVCDSANHQVKIFNKNGKLLRKFGGYGTADGQFDNCAGIAYNRSKQHLVVSDRLNNRIQLFDLDGKFVKSFGCQGTESGKFKEPFGVAVDELGLIYVVDKGNHRIQVFNQSGMFMSKFGRKGTDVGQFDCPLYIAIHKRTQNIFISDTGNHRICVHDGQGIPILNFGVEGFHTGQLKLPRAIVVDDQGFVSVADSGNNRIQIFSPEGKFVHGFGTWGASPGQLKGVEGIALIDDQLVVSDRENNRIQIF